MRKISFLLGVVGGLAGVGVHAFLLIRFFSQSSGLFQVFLQLALAAALGLAAILVAILCRSSQRTLAVFLPLLGVLGFFPRPLTWAPAGALLVAGGLVAFFTLRRGLPAERPIAQPSTMLTPDGRPLHWSEAARMGVSAAPPATHARAASESWSPSGRVGVIAAALVAAAIVIPVSIWASGDQTATAASVDETTTTVLSASTVTTQPTQETTTTSTARDTTTTAPRSTTTTVPANLEGLDSFSDSQRGIAMYYPEMWRNTDPAKVGAPAFWEYERVFWDQWSDAYVAGAFADWQGPTMNGCYLDFIWVEVHDDVDVDASMMADFEEWLSEGPELTREYDPSVKILEPLDDVVVSGLPGLTLTWSFFANGYALVLRECYLVSDDCYYYLAFAAIREDWDTCEPLYRTILESFQATTTAPLI